MKYQDIFNSAEVLVSQRLAELPGDEVITMKQAGYNSVWKTFLDNYFQDGWEDTVKKASLVDLGDTYDPFEQGQQEAIEAILEANEDLFARGWFSFVKEAHDVKKKGGSVEDFCKEAQLNMPDNDNLEVVGFLAASQNVLESDHDLVEIAWNGPNTTTETEQMSAFELGKEAALEELLDFASQGASVADCLEVINETVNQDLDKYASEEDAEFRLGVETFCYDFLKEAGQVYGEYDTSDSYDSDILELIFDQFIPEDEGVFGMGKIAAFNELLDHAANGADIDDVVGLVQETLEQELSKNASVEDADYHLGVQAMCHGFMKVASEVYAQYDLGYTHGQDILEFVLEKIAENLSGVSDAERKAANAKYNPKLKQRVGVDAKGNPKYKANPKQKNPKDQKGGRKNTTNKSKPTVMATEYGGPAQTAAQRGVGGKELKKRLKDNPSAGHAGARGGFTMRENAGRLGSHLSANKGKYGKGALGAGALLAGGAAINHLATRRRRKQEEAQGGQRKAASLYDPRVQDALAILDEAGLLDD